VAVGAALKSVQALRADLNLTSEDVVSTTLYTWENGMIAGRRRLELLEEILDAATERRFDSIGVRQGWRCLELGAGGGSACDMLCRRVGASGRVTAIDIDTRFVRFLKQLHSNLEIREENILDVDLPVEAFDLVHTRFTLVHIPQREALLEKLIATLKPGGMLFLEEPDGHSVDTLDTSAWHDLTMRVLDIIDRRGSDILWARGLPARVLSLGLRIVRADVDLPYFQGASNQAEFWKMTWAKVRDTVVATGIDVERWNSELAVLDDPSQIFPGLMTVSVIATKP
jgi:2-polyprenyl-3-methyl-5-hydroxy-6-metoxy-1,4-benzoquinol methylase